MLTELIVSTFGSQADYQCHAALISDLQATLAGMEFTYAEVAITFAEPGEGFPEGWPQMALVAVNPRTVLWVTATLPIRNSLDSAGLVSVRMEALGAVSIASDTRGFHPGREVGLPEEFLEIHRRRGVPLVLGPRANEEARVKSGRKMVHSRDGQLSRLIQQIEESW